MFVGDYCLDLFKYMSGAGNPGSQMQVRRPQIPQQYLEPSWNIHGHLSARENLSVLRDEWREIKEIMNGPPPQCTHPAVLRRWQMLMDLRFGPAVAAFRRLASTQSRPWTRLDTLYYLNQF